MEEEEHRSFQITLISASGLQDVRHHGEMKVYAKVSISGNSDSEWTTGVDKEGKINPYWNCQIRYSIPEETVQEEGRDNLFIKLYCKRSLLEDKYVGELNLSLKKLFDNGLARENIDYNVCRNDAEGCNTFGTLKISYSFGSLTKNINVQGQSCSSTRGTGHGGRFPILLGALADGVEIWNALYSGAQFLFQLIFGSDED